MPTIVVDTDVVSYLSRSDSRALLYLPDLQDAVPVITFQTVAELHFWTLTRQWGAARQAQLQEHLRQFAVKPWEPELCRLWAAVRYACQQRGRRIRSADAWHAATARYLDVPLLTHNRRDYDAVPDLAVISHAP